MMNFFRTQVQMRFSDFDMLRHLNNTCYSSYIELARISFFDEVIAPGNDWSEKGIILARLEIDFRVPVLMDDTLFIDSSIGSMGRKSFEMIHHFMVKTSDGFLQKANAKSVLVCYNYQNNTSILLPKDWKFNMMKWNESVVNNN